MTNNSNLPVLDEEDPKRIDTNTYFNNVFMPKISVPVNTDAAVTVFFERIAGDTESAKLLAQAVIYTALTQQLNPMAVIAEFKKIEPGKLNTALAGFLNQNRVNTSLLGVINQPKTNFFVRRSILA